MFYPVQLPYKSNKANIELPTAEEIRACRDLIYERHAGKIVHISENVVVKFGRSVTEQEGQALIYLEQHASEVPAPRLYGMYRDSHEIFLVMRHIPGVRLDLCWPSLSHSEKGEISSQLGAIMANLRGTPCPRPDFFGGLDGGSIHHHLFYDQRGTGKHIGPFSGETQFANGLTSNYRASREYNNIPTFKADFWDSNLTKVLRGHRPVLTHGDLQKRNIIVAEKEGYAPEAGTRKFEVTLVDWEMAGWLPDFWEYFCASLMFSYLGWDDDWCLQVGRFLTVPLAEAAVMREFEKELS